MDATIERLLKKFKDSESSTSAIFGVVVVVVVGLLLINFLKGDKPAQVSNNGEATESASLSAPAVNGYTQPVLLPSKHTVTKGEHLWAIAEKYYGSGYNWVDIAKENKLSSNVALAIGAELSIPNTTPLKMTVKNTETVTATTASVGKIESESYTVVKGDTLWSIAVRAYGDGFKWNAIYEANKDKVANPRVIEVGQALAIPR